MLDKERIRVIGFDLDGNLYPETAEINDRIRTEIATRLILKKPELKDAARAREYFEQRYAELHSGRKVLLEAGYGEEAGSIMDRCIATADVADLIARNPRLNPFLTNLKNKYTTFLLTSSPEESSRKKLEALGINAGYFNHTFYSDTPNIGYKTDGTAFQNATRLMNVDPKNCVYVGNSKQADILPAKQRGMQTIAVWSNIPEADLSISNINDLEGILL